MKKAQLARLLQGRGEIASKAEKYTSIVINMNPIKWNFLREADALLDLLKALESEGIIEIKQ